MDFEEVWSCVFWAMSWLVGVAVLHWGAGWSWWGAVPVPFIPAFLVSAGVYGLIDLVRSLVGWGHQPRGVAVVDLEDVFEKLSMPVCELGYMIGGALLHWKWGWSWWWVVPLSLVPGFLALMVFAALFAILDDFDFCWPLHATSTSPPPPQDDEDDLGEEDSEPEPSPWAHAPRAAPMMDELSKKLFAQLDDPMPGQRTNALELLRARLAKTNRSFRDLLHDFESRHE